MNVQLKLQRVVRCCRRQRGITDSDRKLLDDVEEAALFSCHRFFALFSLRKRMNKLFMESEGLLFEFMLLWFAGGLFASESAEVDSKTRDELIQFRMKSSDEQVREVLGGSSLVQAAKKLLHSDFFIKPQGAAKLVPANIVADQNRSRLEQTFPSILRALAFFEEDKTSIFPELPLKFKEMKLPDPKQAELMELAAALQEQQQEVFFLCTAKPTLTHLENFQLALLHVRLWLLHSELPVCFGCDVTYSELRTSRTFEEVQGFQHLMLERAQELLPSNVETHQMIQTVHAHARLKDAQQVYHMKSTDYLDSACWLTPGKPVTIVRGKKEMSLGYIICRPGIEEEDDDVEQTVRVFENQEPLRVLAQLKKFNAKSFARFGQNHRATKESVLARIMYTVQ